MAISVPNPRPYDHQEWMEACTSPLVMLLALAKHHGLVGLDSQAITPYPHVVELDRHIEALCKGRLYASGPGPMPKITASYRNPGTNDLISGEHPDWYTQTIRGHKIPDGYFLEEISYVHPHNGEALITSCGVFYPTRYGKSFMCSLASPAWYVLLNPVTRVLVGGHTARFAEAELGSRMQRFLRQYAAVIGRPLARDPGMSQMEFADTSSITFFGIDTGVIGRTKRFGVLDDPAKSFREVKSEETRARHGRFFTGEWGLRDTFVPGFPPPCELHVASRIHPEDLAGTYVVSPTDPTKPREGWAVLHLKALITDADGTERSSCEAMRRTADLKVLRTAEPYVFYSQCQNSPILSEVDGFPKDGEWPTYRVSADGGLIPLAGPQTGEELSLDLRFATLDLAGSKNRQADWTVVAVWDYHRSSRQLFLRHICRKRVELVDHMRWAREELAPWHSAYPINHATVESGPISLLMLQSAGREPGYLGFNLWEPNRATSGPTAMSKQKRHEIYAQAAHDGRVLIPAEEKPWYRLWISEHELWPSSSKDDQLDVGADAVLEANRHSSHVPASEQRKDPMQYLDVDHVIKQEQRRERESLNPMRRMLGY